MTESDVVPLAADEVRQLLELGDQVRESLNPDGVFTCPIRGCAGHEGPHGSLFGAPLEECE